MSVIKSTCDEQYMANDYNVHVGSTDGSYIASNSDSSYSCLLIHICWKVDTEARIEPPIHVEYSRSGGAIILIFIVGGANAVISFCILSAMPGNIVFPPDSIVLAYRDLHGYLHTSHFMMDL